MKGFKRVAFAVLAVVVLSGCNGTGKENEPKTDDKSVTLTVAEMHMAEHPITKGTIYFGEQVEEKTHGRIKIDVHPAGLLGTENAVIAKVCNGTLDMARVNCVALSESSPCLKPLTLPYLIKSREHLWRVLDSEVGDDMLNNLINCKGIAWLDSGSRCFYAKKEIRSPQDMKGLSFRVPSSEIMNSFMEKCGAKAVNMDFSQIYAAIENGTISGAENDIISYSSAAHNVVAKNFVMDNHSFSPSVLIMSEKAKEKISDEDYEIIMQCASDTEAKSRELWIAKEKEIIEQVKKQGDNIIELTPEQKAAFSSVASEIYGLYPECNETVEKIKQLGDNY